MEHGVTATLCYYSRRFSEIPLKETLVRKLKNEYCVNLKKPSGSTSSCDVEEIKELHCKKTGKPLLLGEELDKQVKRVCKNIYMIVLLCYQICCRHGSCRRHSDE